MHETIIVGGGLAGSLTAIYLARRGYDVRVLEKRSDPLRSPSPAHERTSSRAIGVSMNVRGMKAVLRAGIPAQELARCGEPITGMAFCVGGKYKIRKLTPLEDLSPLSLNRLAFQQLLNQHAALLGVKFHFDCKCINVDLEKKSVLVQEGDGGFRHHRGDLIIGADGAHSAVRQSMQSGLRRFEFKQTFFRHGYKTLVLPNAAELGYRKDFLYFFGMDSKGLFAGRAATIPDGSISFAICLPYQGALSLATQDGATLRAFFNHYFGGLPPGRRQEMLDQFVTQPSNDLVNVRASTFHHRGNALLLGDAAHATAPFLGQGMNMALEDASVFATLLDQHAHDLDTVLPEFTRQRKVQADAMQDMSIANYEVLSHPSVIFFLRAQYARYMHKKFPSLYPPDMAEKLYFDSVPYDELRRLQRKQNVWYRLGRMN
ncbi:FAD-dependent monooxygenase [Myxococcus sp. K38C18041901]|uniref:FAD-dependent oxidoreductase n=1 Tax=Myxococcus guangdongensis TaxID=2906760 RepID=UPI0020A79E56|nr:NAD(P)/FAD-dependent oxidoreductase [Myxococcus guangdongensis]MCP3064205.1 FAD-dependent monooxygenase [Myxococcus guangdongensis]